MALNPTNFAPFLKTLWPQSRVENLTYQNQPLYALVPKMTGFGGANAVITVQYGDTQGRSSAFATAQANKGNLNSKAFTVTRAKDYALASVDGEVIDASQGNDKALASAWDREVSSALHALKRSIGQSLYGDGTGAVGQSNSTASPMTLLQIRDIVNFEVGDQINASPNADLSSPRTGTGTITAINRGTGVITYTGTITSLAASDYIYKAGDGNAKMKGLKAWIPTAAPSATTFFGVDRTADTTRLAGLPLDVSAMSPSEGLLYAANQLGIQGASPSHMFCHFDQYTNIQHDLGAKVMYEELRVGEIGFEAIRINGPTGPIKVIPDLNCPYGFAWMLQLDTWELMSLGAMPKFLDFDGLKMLRESTSDAYEVRVGYYAQLVCNAPGWNACLTMPT